MILVILGPAKVMRVRRRDSCAAGALPSYILSLSHEFSKTKGAFLLSKLAGQTHQFAKKMQQFDGNNWVFLRSLYNPWKCVDINVL